MLQLRIFLGYIVCFIGSSVIHVHEHYEGKYINDIALEYTMAFDMADSKDLYANNCLDWYNLLVWKKNCNIGIHIIFF